MLNLGNYCSLLPNWCWKRPCHSSIITAGGWSHLSLITMSKSDLIHSFLLCNMCLKRENSVLHYFVKLWFKIWKHISITHKTLYFVVFSHKASPLCLKCPSKYNKLKTCLYTSLFLINHRWWLITNKVVYRHYIYSFYLLVHLLAFTMGINHRTWF